MKVQVITPIYNESELLPYFLRHYRYVDNIIFLYDNDTTDNTLKVISKHKKCNVSILPFNFKDGLDDTFLVNISNRIINESAFDYSICVDADELIFFEDYCKGKLSIRFKDFINETKQDYYDAAIFSVYPHGTEKPVPDSNKPIWESRKFGHLDNLYIKPCIVKNGIGLSHIEGKHLLKKNGKIIPKTNDDYDMLGIHLNNLNLEFAKKRRFERFNRISQHNRDDNFGNQYYQYDEKEIELEFEKKYDKLW